MVNKLGQNRYAILTKYIFPMILILYPLRHICIGLDLRDTGYNYANFYYMGLDHMDPMWLFSTYLANAIGHFFTLLPGGLTLLGLNLYTALVISTMAFLGYCFCTKKLQMPSALVFLGEFVAISLCWAPGAVLYHYLSYGFFFFGAALLYLGLIKKNNKLLVLAGVVLGSSIFVRFPNLTQAALIVALWGYGFLKRKKFGQVAKETGFCLAGYLGAIALFLGYISLRYGFSYYTDAIVSLFTMTENATDYKATSMLSGIFTWYKVNLYWVIRIAFFMVLGVMVSLPFPKRLKKMKATAAVLLAAAAVFWLYSRDFCSLDFTTYESMVLPAVLFLMLTLFICGVQIVRKGASPEEKLLAMIVAMIVFITSIGSNNGLYPSINNLFLAAPYVFYTVWRFFRYEKVAVLFPVKAVCAAFLCMFLVQSIGFGTQFVFVESAGAKNTDTKTENSAILKGIYMSAERAEWLDTITAYVEEQNLSGREVILYGNIPSLSFYLNMPSAFNPWSDLPSYRQSAMEEAIAELEAEIADGEDYPVVIFEKSICNKGQEDPKLALIEAYMDRYAYTLTFENDKFALYEAEKRNYD